MTSEMLAAEANLIVDGTLESVTNLPSAEFRCSNDNSSGGRLELFTEDLSWNKCCKLVSGATHDEMAGGKMRKDLAAWAFKNTKLTGVVFALADHKVESAKAWLEASPTKNLCKILGLKEDER